DGALEQLLTNGPEAFDKAIADSQAQTQALMKPTVAPNAYNESKRAEHAALGRYFAERSLRDDKTPQSLAERQAVKDHAVAKYLREHPGANRKDVEAAWDREVAEARARSADAADAKALVIPDDTLVDARVEELRAMAGTHMPRLPAGYDEDWSTEAEHE